jgi:putative phage-type endonuclease
MRIEHHGISPVFGAIKAAFPASESEWLAFRRDYLCASEFGVAAGVSPFETINQLVVKKKYNQRAPFSEAMRLGHELEPRVARAAADKWGFEIQKVDYFLFCEDFKIGATLDYVMKLDDGTWCPLEIKTTSERNLKFGWLKGIPPHYKYQLELQCALFSNDPRGRICVFTKDSKQLLMRDIMLTPERISHLHDVSLGFWQRFNK